MPRLYEIPEGSKIKEECFKNGEPCGSMITFDHIDGMYSYCTVDGMEGNNVIHLKASTPLKWNEEGYYEIDEE